jgi:hypothetical protein
MRQYRKSSFSYEIELKPDFSCGAEENYGRCNSKQGLIRIGDYDPPKYWCIHHYEKFRVKSDIDIDKEIDRRSILFKDAAKIAGMSSSAYCLQHIRDMGLDKTMFRGVLDMLKGAKS